VLQHLAWAAELLDYSTDECRREFQREFVTYWSQAEKNADAIIRSLLKPAGPSRNFAYYRSNSGKQIVAAENEADLVRWLRHAGIDFKQKWFRRGRFHWLDEPLVPSEFPRNGDQLLDIVGGASVGPLIIADQGTLVILGAQTETGAGLVAARMEAVSQKILARGGFRSASGIPVQELRARLGRTAVSCIRTRRVDGPWVHGRGGDLQYPVLAEKRVCIVGCGALGSYIADQLAQSGVGTLALVDDDLFSSANISRHVLGNPDIGRKKAEALAKHLLSQYPHMSQVAAYPVLFERLKPSERADLAPFDLIITAGIPYASDLAVEQWRLATLPQPTHISTWTEEFALVGHAALRCGTDSLTTLFDAEGLPTISQTSWPDTVRTIITEAGCGNGFQPHGVVDLQSVVTLGARLALDYLTGRAAQSTRRVWFGDRNKVLELGGTLTTDFTQAFTTGEFP
jgi:hypothetical protein